MRRILLNLLLLLFWTQPVWAATTFLDPGTSATFGFEQWVDTFQHSSDATVVHGQPRSIKLTTGATPDWAWVRSQNGVVANAGGRLSYYVRFPSVAPSASGRFLTLSNASAVEHLYVNLTTDGKISHFWLGGPTTTSASALNANTWHQIVIAWTWTSTTVNEFRLWVDGTLFITTSNQTTSTVALSAIYPVLTPTLGTNFVVYHSDFYADNSASLTFPGDIRVTAKRPNANGTAVDWATGIGSDPGSPYGSGHAVRENERALNTANGWSTTSTASAVEEYSIESAATGDADLTGATIVDYMGWVYAKAGTALTANIIVANAASNVSLTTTNTMFTKAAGSTTYPGGNTDIGMNSGTTAGTKSLYECGILVAYIPGTAPAVGFFRRRIQ